MAGVLDQVDRRTQLAGNNRMELLLFRLTGKQRYGINVFKVREVIHCPSLTHIPHSHPVVRGVVTIRGNTIPIMDLSMAVGMASVGDPQQCFVIVAEYNRTVQGFLVSAVERIVNMRWDDVQPPPRAAGNSNYLTAVTRVDEELVEILDVEKVLAEVVNLRSDMPVAQIEAAHLSMTAANRILVADDSSVARNQIKRALEQMGFETELATNGKEALNMLKHWAEKEPDKLQTLMMVISDVEMPEMDGYTLTAEIRRDPRLTKLYVMLHTSLSGVFNTALVEKVGANQFIPKFKAEELGNAVLSYAATLKEKAEASGSA